MSHSTANGARLGIPPPDIRHAVSADSVARSVPCSLSLSLFVGRRSTVGTSSFVFRTTTTRTYTKQNIRSAYLRRFFSRLSPRDLCVCVNLRTRTRQAGCSCVVMPALPHQHQLKLRYAVSRGWHQTCIPPLGFDLLCCMHTPCRGDSVHQSQEESFRDKLKGCPLIAVFPFRLTAQVPRFNGLNHFSASYS